MIRVRSLRFMTTLAILAVAGFTCYSGVQLAHFGIAERGLAESADVEGVMTPYLGYVGLSSNASSNILRYSKNLSSEARADQLGKMFETAAVSPLGWAQMARLHLANGADSAKASAALTLSYLTGPNESDAMAARAVVALSIWESLTPDLRRPAITDVTGGWSYLSASQLEVLRRSLSFADPDVRAQIRSALLLAGKNGSEIGKALGLDDGQKTD